MLEEKDSVAIINSYTRQDWQPLLELIPDIEKTESFGEWAGGTSKDGQSRQFPHFVQAPVISRFLEIANDMPILIVFNWMGWSEGREMINDKNFDFDSVDVPTKCKVISAIVRSERFAEGSLAEAFSSGQMLRILKSIEKQVGEN